MERRALVKRRFKVMNDDRSVSYVSIGDYIDISDWTENVERAHVKRGFIEIVPTMEEVKQHERAAVKKAPGNKKKKVKKKAKKKIEEKEA